MLSCKSLLICLPLLTVAVSCGGKSGKKSSPAPQNTDSTPVAPGDTPAVEQPVGTNPVNDPAAPATPVDPAAPATPSTPATPATPVAECDEIVIDFEKDADGQVMGQGLMIKDQYAKLGIRFSSIKYSPGKAIEQTPVLFDSFFKPNGLEQDAFKEASIKYGNDEHAFDWDLTTTTNGKLLIIAENLFDGTDDNIANATYPDDNNWGGKFIVKFDKPTKVTSMEFIDLEDGENAIETYVVNADSESRVARQAISNVKNNEITAVTVNKQSYVNRLEILVHTGGGLDNLKVCVKK